MKDSRSCPEDLIVRASHGILAVRRDEQLDSHLRQCSACRAELAVAQAFKEELAGYPGVRDLGHRVAAAVDTELALQRRATPRGQRRNAAWYLLAAAVILMSIAAFAARDSTLRRRWQRASSPADPSMAPTAPPVAPAVAEHADESPPPPVTTLPDAPPAEPSPADRPTPAPQARSATDSPGYVGGSPQTPAPTARELFSSANSARRASHGLRASSLYRELQQRYPSSPEALVSRVSFGRVLLEQLGDPAGALAQFDGYLAQTTQTALAEEALFGRATALSQLGRLDAERETWRTLLARYPSSIYAERARVRTEGIQ